MKESDTALSFYSSVFIQLIFVLLLIIIWSYIYKLENIGCACSEHSNKEFIKNFTIIALVYFFITAFIPMKTIAKNMGNTIDTIASRDQVRFSDRILLHCYQVLQVHPHQMQVFL